jgi:hypothetical protein
VTTCATCGNDYARPFEVVMYDGSTAVFDSFECAIQRLAPRCAHCGVRVVGHGVEVGAMVFCGAHCARRAGREGPVDRVGDGEPDDARSPSEEDVDRALEGSFPASDPPSFWARDIGEAS